MEFFEGILKLATDLTDTLSAGGPKTIIFIILLNFAVGLVVVRCSDFTKQAHQRGALRNFYRGVVGRDCMAGVALL